MTKGKGGKTFEAGDLVFAKVRGYPPWPARVQQPTAKSGTKYQVFFFGTYETAVCKKEELWKYSEETKAKYGKQKRKGFAEGLQELEQTPNIGMESGDNHPPPLDASALDSTAGDATLDSTADMTGAADKSTVSQADEDEEEAGLTIDEQPATSKSKKTPSATPAATPTTANGAAKKRKADDTPSAPPKKKVAKTPAATVSTPSASAATPAKPEEQESTETPNSAAADSAKTSRSGRAIKPKKFADDGIQQNTPNKAGITPKSSTKLGGNDPRKMWVHVKDTGDMLEINLDKDRPVKFDSKEAEIQWEKGTATNALKFKTSVESGEYIPEEIRKKIEEKAQRTPKEEEILKKEKVLSVRKEKIRWLKVEQRLIDLDIEIKTALHYQRPNMSKCLEHLDALLDLQVAPLMFKKQPDIVTTIRKLRKYIGPEDHPASKDTEKEWKEKSERIRIKSDAVFHKIQSCFTIPEGKSFWDSFEMQLTEYREVTKDMDQELVIHMVNDPTASKN